MGGSGWAKRRATAEAGEEGEEALAAVANNEADRKGKRGEKS